MKGSLKGQTEVLTLTLVINLGFFKLTEINQIIVFVKGIAFPSATTFSGNTVLSLGFVFVVLIGYIVYIFGVGGACYMFFKKRPDISQPIVLALSAFFSVYVAILLGSSILQLPLSHSHARLGVQKTHARISH